MPPHYAKTPDDLATMDQIWSLSGLEFMRAVQTGTLAGAPIAGLFGFTPDKVEKGHVIFRGTPRFEALNPMGAVHGGWYGTLLDSAMGCAVMTVLPKGSIYTTLEYKVNITRSVPVGMEALATGQVQHSGRSTAVANGQIRGAQDGILYATASTTCIVMQRD